MGGSNRSYDDVDVGRTIASRRGDGDAGSDECLELNKRTTVNASNPPLVLKLQPGERLAVRLDPLGTGRIEVVVPFGKASALAPGTVVGSLTFTHVAELRRCLARGVSFVSAVASVTGGEVLVDVFAGAP